MYLCLPRAVLYSLHSRTAYNLQTVQATALHATPTGRALLVLVALWPLRSARDPSRRAPTRHAVSVTFFVVQLCNKPFLNGRVVYGFTL